MGGSQHDAAADQDARAAAGDGPLETADRTPGIAIERPTLRLPQRQQLCDRGPALEDVVRAWRWGRPDKAERKHERCQ